MSGEWHPWNTDAGGCGGDACPRPEDCTRERRCIENGDQAEPLLVGAVTPGGRMPDHDLKMAAELARRLMSAYGEKPENWRWDGLKYVPADADQAEYISVVQSSHLGGTNICVDYNDEHAGELCAFIQLLSPPKFLALLDRFASLVAGNNRMADAIRKVTGSREGEPILLADALYTWAAGRFPDDDALPWRHTPPDDTSENWLARDPTGEVYRGTRTWHGRRAEGQLLYIPTPRERGTPGQRVVILNVGDFGPADWWCTPLPFGMTPREQVAGRVDQLEREVVRLNDLLNTPGVDDFIEAMRIEAGHQRERWGEGHDDSKSPEDWFWTLGYLGGKANSAAKVGDLEKAKHHTITAAALLFQWHRRLVITEAYGFYVKVTALGSPKVLWTGLADQWLNDNRHLAAQTLANVRVVLEQLKKMEAGGQVAFDNITVERL